MGKPKPIIAVDIDDVLANSTEALRIEVNTRLGVDLQPEAYQIKGDYYNYYETVWRLNELAERITMDELDPQMKADQSHVLPHKGAAETLKKLGEQFELIIVTGRSSTWKDATERWLQQHFPDTFTKVLFGEGYQGIQRKSKGELCREHKVTWLIDDNVEHAQSAHDLGVNVVLFGEYGWQYHAPADFIRCADWKAVQEYFDGIA